MGSNCVIALRFQIGGKTSKSPASLRWDDFIVMVNGNDHDDTVNDDEDNNDDNGTWTTQINRKRNNRK